MVRAQSALFRLWTEILAADLSCFALCFVSSVLEAVGIRVVPLIILISKQSDLHGAGRTPVVEGQDPPLKSGTRRSCAKLLHNPETDHSSWPAGQKHAWIHMDLLEGHGVAVCDLRRLYREDCFSKT